MRGRDLGTLEQIQKFCPLASRVCVFMYVVKGRVSAPVPRCVSL